MNWGCWYCRLEANQCTIYDDDDNHHRFVTFVIACTLNNITVTFILTGSSSSYFRDHVASTKTGFSILRMPSFGPAASSSASLLLLIVEVVDVVVLYR